MQKLFDEFGGNPLRMIQVVGVILLASLVYSLAVLIALAVMEGIWGWSPGKLACGIRVIRTTLQPLGVLRALIRQILLIIDALFNYLVGVLMIAIMPRQQRLGDLAADAIVVDAASVPDLSRDRR